MTEIWLEKYPGRKPFSASWVITAPWAHPAWSQYVGMLYDLTTPTERPPTIYLPKATHEFILHAADPKVTLVRTKRLEEQQLTLLHPANYGYQFIANDDQDALQRIAKVMALIRGGHLSPDTDYNSDWNSLFQDAHSLKKGDR